MSQTKKLIQIDQTHLVPQRIPVITLRDLTFFPGQIQPLTIGRSLSLKALTNAIDGEGYVLFLAQKNSEMEDPLGADIYQIGVISRILETTWLSNGHAEVVFQGIERAKCENLDQSGTSLTTKFLPMPSKPLEEKKQIASNSFKRCMNFSSNTVGYGKNIPSNSKAPFFRQMTLSDLDFSSLAVWTSS